MARLGVAVQENHRAAFAADVVMQFDSIDVGVVFDESGGNFAGCC